MAKGEEIPRTNPAEVENLIEQIRGTNLEPGAKEDYLVQCEVGLKAVGKVYRYEAKTGGV
jgi:hypothetical protein